MRTLGRRGPAPEWVVALVVAAASAVPILWNIGSSPDTMFDEVSYVMAMRNIALGGDYTWSNQPVFVHPPLSFVLQAGWQWLWGLADADLETSVRGARVFAGLATVGIVVLTALIARRLMTAATPRRRAVLTVVIVALAATDPILLRYLRMAIIEPFAVGLSLLVLYLAMRLDARRPAVYVPLIGTMTGLALLTKEMSVFLVATPLVAAVLARDLTRAKRALGALAVGGVVWLAFPAWAVGLGLAREFADEKLLLFYRLLGIVQTTGWNRPGFSSRSLLEATAIAGRDYGTSYLVLLGGGLALVWLLLRVPDGGSRWLLAWLLTSYGFGGYMVAFGSLNEHLFVYLVPAAVVGTVLVGDAFVARARPARAVALGLVVVAVGFSLGGWVRNDVVDGDGVFRSAAYLRDTRAACDVVNGIGDSGKWAPLLPGRELTDFGTGQAAKSHGVHLFFVSGKDPAVGNALPELPAWITAHGTRLASFPSATYGGLELWEVPADPFDPLADVEPTRDGVFVTTVGSRCGGYPVLGALAARWEERGGKGVLGPPRGSASGTTQVFAGAVLTDAGARPVVRELAAADPAAYAAAGLPPVTAPGGLDDGALTDPAIRAAYLRAPEGTPGAFTSAANRLGAPLGLPTTNPDGSVSQAFAAVVLTRAAGSDVVRAAPVGDLAVRAGLVPLPAESTVPVAPPPLAGETAPDRPSGLRGFAGALLVLLVGVAGVPAVVVLARRRTPGAPPHHHREQP